MPQTTEIHVIEAIDNALHDWQTSPDAMRWTPDPSPRPLVAPPLIELDVTVNLQPFMEAINRATAKLAEMVPAMMKVARVLADFDERACAARHRPIALKIDGHEYRRRSKRRRR